MTESDLDILAAKIAARIQPPGRWMKLKQAVLYSSIGELDIVRLAKENQIVGFQDQHLKTKPWIFDRKSIDRYREKQAMERASNEPTDDDTKVALEIYESLGL